MRNFTTFLIFTLTQIVLCSNAFSQQGAWLQLNDFAGLARHDGVAFTIGTKGYVSTGITPGGGYSKDLWEYDPSTDSWAQKANFGGPGRAYAVGFSVGSKGYIGLGTSVNGMTGIDTFYFDFWEYNPGTNTWSQKANFGGGARWAAVGFGIGTKGYVGTGRTGTCTGGCTYNNDFWEYNPSTNTWTQKANFGGGIRADAIAFSIGTKGYVGTGVNSGTNLFDDFWEYNPSTNVWSQKANFGGGIRTKASSFTIGNLGYVCVGRNSTIGTYTCTNDCWEYNPTTNNWIAKANILNGSGYGISYYEAVTFGIGNKGYLTTGSRNCTTTTSVDVWEFDPTTTVTIGSVNTNFCVGDTIYVPYTATGNFGWNNTFAVEISDSNGIFWGGAWLGGVQSTQSGVIPVVLDNWNTGSGYRFRITSDYPYILSTDNGTDITINDLPNASITPGDTTICSGQGANLIASGGVSYSWSTGASTSVIMVNPTLTTTYLVTVTSAYGCKDTTSRKITVINSPTATINPTTPIICTSSSSTTLIAGGGGTYLWSTGSTSSILSAPSSPLGTTYTVTVTGSNGCSSSVSRIVTRNPVVSISPSTVTICSGLSATLNASGGGTYSWNTGDTLSSITVSPISATNYSVTVTGANACSASASRTVNIYSTPSVTISADGVITTADTITCGEVVQLQLNGSLNAIPNIQWSPNSTVNNVGISNPLVYPTISTNYSVTFTNSNGCIQGSSILVYVNSTPTIGNISITTPSGAIGLFDTLILNVELTNVTDLYGLFMKLKGDPAVTTYLNYVGYTAGTLLGTGGSIISTPPTVVSGVYDFGITKIGSVPGYSGSGVFYSFKFVTKNVTIPNNTNFCFYLDNISAYNSLGLQVGLINQGPYCYTFTDQVNVWPGDLNNSKSVTTADLLPIGYFYNSTGPTRPNATIQWIAQPATLWGYGQTYPNGSAYKVFADSNGDGIISNADQTAIGFNMGQIHALVGNNFSHNERALGDGDIIVTPLPSGINTTQLPQSISLQVSLSNSGGLNSLYGISFNLLFDKSIFDVTSANIDYNGSIFGNIGSDCLFIHYVTDSSVSVGLTRYANAAINGQGLLCNVNLQTKASISSAISQTHLTGFVDAANNQFGDPLTIQDATVDMNVGTNTGINNLLPNYFSIYPNPANETFYIENTLSENELKDAKLVIYNSLGQLVYESKITQNLQAILTRTWSTSGLFLVEIRNREGTVIANKKCLIEN